MKKSLFMLLFVSVLFITATANAATVSKIEKNVLMRQTESLDLYIKDTYGVKHKKGYIHPVAIISGYVANKIVATENYPVKVVLKSPIFPSCNITGLAQGLLSSERVYLAIKKITCSGKSKNINGFANSYNGKTGLIGKVIVRSKKPYFAVKQGTKITIILYTP
jgi:hypothetical protein